MQIILNTFIRPADFPKKFFKFSLNTQNKHIFMIDIYFTYDTCIIAPKSFLVRSLSRKVSEQNSRDETIFAPSILIKSCTIYSFYL